jgi:hypothetical protein
LVGWGRLDPTLTRRPGRQGLRRADVLGVMGALSTSLGTDFGERVYFHELR